MPAVRKASTKGKRKAPPSESEHDSNSDSESGSATQPQASSKKATASKKKAKVATAPKKVVDIPPPANGMPTNTKLPETIEFARPAEGSVRIASWNVCSMASCLKKGFKSYVEAEDPDILLLTETKVNNTPIDSFLTSKFPHQYWNISDTKGYAGTAVLSKVAPVTSTLLIAGHPDPAIVKGRIVTLEFPTLFIVGTYVPNAGEKLKTMDRKQEWNTAFEAHIRALDAQKPVIWMGDLNVCPTALDLKNDKTNWNKTAGYTKAEADGFNQILAPSPSIAGSERLVDVWREKHPTDEHYTYFSYRFNCRAKQIGWRLDFFILSERLLPRVTQCEIRNEIYGASDHLPIVLDISGEL